jgi:hypothetical protein
VLCLAHLTPYPPHKNRQKAISYHHNGIAHNASDHGGLLSVAFACFMGKMKTFSKNAHGQGAKGKKNGAGQCRTLEQADFDELYRLRSLRRPHTVASVRRILLSGG